MQYINQQYFVEKILSIFSQNNIILDRGNIYDISQIYDFIFHTTLILYLNISKLVLHVYTNSLTYGKFHCNKSNDKLRESN